MEKIENIEFDPKKHKRTPGQKGFEDITTLKKKEALKEVEAFFNPETKAYEPPKKWSEAKKILKESRKNGGASANGLENIDTLVSPADLAQNPSPEDLEKARQAEEERVRLAEEEEARRLEDEKEAERKRLEEEAAAKATPTPPAPEPVKPPKPDQNISNPEIQKLDEEFQKYNSEYKELEKVLRDLKNNKDEESEKRRKEAIKSIEHLRSILGKNRQRANELKKGSTKPEAAPKTPEQKGADIVLDKKWMEDIANMDVENLKTLEDSLKKEMDGLTQKYNSLDAKDPAKKETKKAWDLKMIEWGEVFKEIRKKEKTKATEPLPAPEPPAPVDPSIPEPEPERFTRVQDKRLRQLRFNDTEALSRREDFGRRASSLFEKIRTKLVDKVKYNWNNWKYGLHEEASKGLAEQLSLYKDEISDLKEQLKEVDGEIEKESKQVDGIRMADYVDLKRDREDILKQINRLEKRAVPLQNKLDTRNRKKTSFENNLRLLNNEFRGRVDQHIQPLSERIKDLKAEGQKLYELSQKRETDLKRQKDDLDEIKKGLENAKRRGSRKIIKRRIARAEARIREGEKALDNCDRQLNIIKKPIDKMSAEVNYWINFSDQFKTHQIEIYDPGFIEKISPEINMVWIGDQSSSTRAGGFVEGGMDLPEEGSGIDKILDELGGKGEEGLNSEQKGLLKKVFSRIKGVISKEVPKSKITKEGIRLMKGYMIEKIKSGALGDKDPYFFIELNIKGKGDDILKKYFEY
jgi:hypothetical protein